MNYKQETLKSKIFNFSKRLLCNTVYAVSIVTVVALLIVHFSFCAIYDVFSNSQYPVLKEGDIIIVQKQQSYKVGDIIKFHDEQTNLPIVHRLISIKSYQDKTYYVCHGDNVQSVTNFVTKDNNTPYLSEWENDSDFVENLSLQALKNEAQEVVQIVEINNVEGKVITKISGLGYVFRFIKNNFLLILLSVLVCVKAYEWAIELNKNKLV